VVPFENTCRRRVNVLASYRPDGPRPRLDWWAAARRWTGADVVGYLRELPASKKPRVVVLDNAGPHVGKAVRSARPALRREGIYLYYLPAYSPELNRIEGVFRQIKYHGLPQRSYATLGGLRVAVEEGFQRYRQQLANRPRRELRPGA
jgi:transposase